MKGGMRLGVDVGGTFTDLVAIGGGEVVTAKVPSTPEDQSRGVMNSIRAADIRPESVAAFAHGMTVATNALLERQGANTALVTTEGFRDVLEIARQNRPSLYDLTRDRPPALIPREFRFTVKERMGPTGEIEPLDEVSLRETVEALRHTEVESVAVCLIFAFMHPEHERRVGELLREELPGLHVSLSSEVLPEFREYERFSTTAADAYLGPRLAAYLGSLDDQIEGAGMPEPLVMRSSGGVVELEAAANSAASCVLSGPAGGVVGAAYVAAASGYRDLLTFDMGGTSTDVAPVIGGEALTTTEAEVAGVPIKLPMADVHTVSAGGGSIAWADEGGALGVGPHSAGAEPGPAAYGLGGEEPTVTDANLYLGYLRDGVELGGEVTLSRERSEQALTRLGEVVGLDPLQTALGVVQLADTEMVRALRIISVERGLDPREFSLVAFGGAGPLHACAIASELGTSTVLVPRASGVLSALGLAVSDVRRDHVAPYLSPLSEADAQGIEESFDKLERTASVELKAQGEPVFERRADLRYGGQSFELPIGADEIGDLDDLAARFHDAHERRYGYRMQTEPVELVNLRLVATVPVDKPEISEGSPPGVAEPGSRVAHLGGAWREIPILDRTEMGLGARAEGPAIVEFTESTCVVPPGWGGEVDGAGTLALRKDGGDV
jgi:N-methylhydantoinase A